MLEFAWDDAAPGREAAAQNEVLSAMSAFGQTRTLNPKSPNGS
jgi:hypothetical protein